MTELDRYLDAATRANTRRSYQSAVRHFEVDWGGHLPATADSVARYLAEHAGRLATNTLKQRLAALAQWHTEHGFVDPTRAPIVRKVLKGIQTVHPSIEKRAEPLLLTQLAQVLTWLEGAAITARDRGDHAGQLRHLRDRALVALGFWRGFRGDELIRLQAEHVRIVPGRGMTCFLPRSKGDRQHQGTTFKVPALSRCCPVIATQDWIAAAAITEGPLFRRVDRWGGIAAEPLHANSLIRLLRRVFTQSGLPAPDDYSGHSLRRGFAAWADANGWDVRTLMEYVGWKDIKSAMRYLDGADPFAQERIEAGLAAPAASTPAPTLALPAPTHPEPSSRPLELTLLLSPFTPRGRGTAQARRLIEDICLAPYRAQRLDADGTRYRLHAIAVDGDTLDEAIARLLDDMHRIADNHRCFLEASLQGDGRHWD
ncbi:site-specific integrase [Novilysobacter arseniciresistens]|uniref:site-specific integrase n=1 Tax=Novilysobacter arseniciresistens TaxID=1385522 RepID=UPI0009DCF985|nr:site-specific integrase [Lysobacter arseniciresistens]